MSNELVPVSRFGIGIDRPTNIDEIWRYAEIFSKSGLFTDCQDAAKAAVKIIAGAELGIPPFQAMRGIDIIKGKTAINANLMATMVKASGNFDYQVREMTEEVCRLEFFERRGAETLLLGPSAFSMEDARKAGLIQAGGMFQKFARNMLFARAMSNGVRWYCPHVTSGAAYTPDELGEAIDEEGNMVRVPTAPIRMVEQSAPTKEDVQEPPTRPFDMQHGETQEEWDRRIDAAMKVKVGAFGMKGAITVAAILSGKEKTDITYLDYAAALEKPDEAWQDAKDKYFPVKAPAVKAETAPSPDPTAGMSDGENAAQSILTEQQAKATREAMSR